jgi:POT family proton-dependent oligopeptide transporter
MLLGLVQFQLTRRHLGQAGLPPPATGTRRFDWLIVSVATAAISVLGLLLLTGWIRIDPVRLANWTTWIIVSVAALYFAWAFLLAGLNVAEKKRMVVIAMLFLASALFWSGFEQAGSSLNLFAERHTLRELPRIAFAVPAGWFQSLNAVFVIALAPVMAALWVALARRHVSPSLTVKIAWGLILMAFGFLIMAVAARQAQSTVRVWPTWLIVTYFVHTIGELCLSPVGLSAVTKLAPARLVGQMMGVWFLGTSLGNLMAGLLAGHASGESLSGMPGRFLQIAIVANVAGFALLLLARPIQRLTGGIQ